MEIAQIYRCVSARNHEAEQLLKHLQEISLSQPNPTSDIKYINMLIQSETQQGQPGFMQTIEYLQTAKKEAELLDSINRGAGMSHCRALIAAYNVWLKCSTRKSCQE